MKAVSFGVHSFSRWKTPERSAFCVEREREGQGEREAIYITKLECALSQL